MADGWLSALDADDRHAFIGEMRDALIDAEGDGNLTPVGRCIAEWQVTACALADPARREVLEGHPGDDDFTEVGRPHG